MKKLIVIASLLLTSCGVVTREPSSDEADKLAADAAAANMNEAQTAYAKANGRMHKGMGYINEDADVAFIQGMIPHHQGAVDMANIVLEHGDDEEAKELARNVIKAQEAEIAWMRSWLKERGLGEAPTSDIDHKAAGH